MSNKFSDDKAQEMMLKNAEAQIKASVSKGEIAYATSDGQIFARAKTPEERKKQAQRHAFRHTPVLKVGEFVGEKTEVKEEQASQKKRKTEKSE